jgi:methylenetetrahydrofolate reductase (NADPH)
MKGVIEMKIGPAIKKKGASLSFEFFPPKDKAGEDKLIEHAMRLKELKPTFVSLTYGAGGSTRNSTKELILRLKQKVGMVSMPHLTCVNQSMDDLKSILEDYKKSGIQNVLALRGDPPKGTEKCTPDKNGQCHAKELVRLAASLSGFSIGVAVYPEGHAESPNLEMDTLYTKEKIDAGADFAITQMFFDNRYYYELLERTKKAGIKIPIIPGIMPINDIAKITNFAQGCGATMPESIIRRFGKTGAAAGNDVEIGTKVAIEQCADLLAHGVRYFHFYTLNRSEQVLRIVTELGLQNLGK